MKKVFYTDLILIICALSLTFHAKSQSLIRLESNNKTISVGGQNANIQGFTNSAIQLANDALPPGGGTIKLSPGLFSMMAPVRLKSNVKLIGSGDSTILKRINGFHSRFIIDADYGELKVTVADSSGFEVGMSIQVNDDINNYCWDITTAKITHIEGNTLYFDTYLIRDYKSKNNGMVTNAGSCILVYEGQNVSISNLKIDGNKDNNDLLDGCNGGGIAILKSKNVTVDKVHIDDFNGEGITWQITDSITVMNCEINGCTGMGLHPGSGSPHSRIENNNSHDNKVGLFICWRVQNSVVSGNQFSRNEDCGISIGHKDFDVVFDRNHIFENGNNGVIIREESPENSPHRNTFINNTIEDNGTNEGGYGFAISGNAMDVVLKGNIIRNSVNGKQKAPILMRKGSPPLKLENNKISGHRLTNGISYE